MNILRNKKLILSIVLIVIILATIAENVGGGAKSSAQSAGEDTQNVTPIIYYSENEKTRDMEVVNDATIAQLEKVPDSSVIYVAVGGYGNPVGMGVHFQNYAVGVCADPIEGYRYVRCDSDTIEFYEYKYNEYLGYDVPWFLVPESGEHYIYVYYEPIE